MIGAVDVSGVADDGLILGVLLAVVVGFVTVPGSGESCRRIRQRPSRVLSWRTVAGGPC